MQIRHDDAAELQRRKFSLKCRCNTPTVNLSANVDKVLAQNQPLKALLKATGVMISSSRIRSYLTSG